MFAQHEWLLKVFVVSCNILHENMSRFMFLFWDCRNLNCIFLCCNRSQSHRFNSLLVTYGLRFPLSLSGPIYPTNLLCWFPWDRTPIPNKWTSASWRVQFTCPESGVIIVTLLTMTSNPSIKMLLNCTLSFDFWSCIDIYQNICVLDPIAIFDSSFLFIHLSRAVWVLQQALDILIFLGRQVLHSDWEWLDHVWPGRLWETYLDVFC